MTPVSDTKIDKKLSHGDAIVAICHKVTKKPACVLIQAAFGGDRRVPMMVDSNLWIVDSVDDLVAVSGTIGQWRKWATMIGGAR